jgi:S-adenosylmethionine hydrolase
MPIVTLTSDWNQHDYYTASLKGAIRTRCPDCEVIDISNQIRSFDVAQCAFVLRYAFASFPAGTIHLMAVQSEPEPLVPMVIVLHRMHYFVGLNDGRFSLLFDEPPEDAFALPVPAEPHSFAALPLFTRAIAAIAESRIETETKTCTLNTEADRKSVV